MEKTRVLLVEDDVELRRSTAEYLAKQPDIQVVGEASDGREALVKMETLSPDVILLDMVMQGMDGWETLRQMRDRGMDCGRVIVVTAIHSPQHIMRASQYGVGYYMLKPFYDLEVLHRRILDVHRGFPPPELSAEDPPAEAALAPDAPRDVDGALLAIGVPAHVKGFLYLREAVHRSVERPERMGQLTTGLYPEIAAQFGTTAPNVERAMRHAIELAWQRTSQRRLDQVFGLGICTAAARPSTGELIALLVNRQLRQMEAESD